MPKLSFGIAVSLTGRYALLGQQVLAGAKTYVSWINTRGGLNIGANKDPCEVELHHIDDQSDESMMEHNLNRLLGKHSIDVLLGPYGSGLGLAAAKFAENHEIVLWNHSSSADQIFTSGFQWTVGLISPASQYLCSVLEMAKHSEIAYRKIALVNATTGFARDMASGVLEWANENHCECRQHTYRSGLPSFEHIVRMVQNAAPDILLAVGRVEDDIRFAKAIVAQGVPIATIGLVVAAIDEFKTSLKLNSEGFLAPSQWEAGQQQRVDYGPTSAQFIDLYRRQTKLPIDYPAAQGFVGALIAGRCVELAGTLDQGALREVANDLDCTTFYGRCLVASKTGRQVGHQMLVTQWQNGKKQIVWPLETANAKFRPREFR